MVIYGNNLHEKLQGIAISKDYIKYATPFCDFVDDPELAPDIDLAVNFNQAINGNPIAATRFTDTLILSGYLFDSSTKEYYRNRMTSNSKVWGNLILNTKLGFETNAFEDALKDCLNSPCNLFAETSDSVARLAQVASTKNGSNSFGVGDLSATFINITNGLDEAVTKKLPAIFSGAALELTQNIKSARSNIEAVVAGKKNLNELTSLANASGTMRGTNKIYRYTPDLKSYTDYTNLGNNILLKVKQTLGGCFERFESAYRYNPYEDNTSVPATVQEQQYNGTSFKTEPNGVLIRKPFTTRLLSLLTFGLFDEDDSESEAEPNLNSESARLAERSDLNNIDPETKRLLYELTQAEVGSQGRDAQIAFMETVANRAAAEGRSIKSIVTDVRYYQPLQEGTTKSVNSTTRNNYNSVFNEVVAGSNITRGATHNASAGVARAVNAGGYNSNVDSIKVIGGETFYSKDLPKERNWLEKYNSKDVIDTVDSSLTSKVDRLNKSRATYGLNDAEIDRWLANASKAEKRKEADLMAKVLDGQSEIFAKKAQESYNRAVG